MRGRTYAKKIQMLRNILCSQYKETVLCTEDIQIRPKELPEDRYSKHPPSTKSLYELDLFFHPIK